MRQGQRTSRRIVVVMTDRHGLRRPILDEISSAALFITLDGRYDGSSQAQRFVEGLHSKTLELLEYGYWDYFSELHDEPAGWTVIDTTDRHELRSPTLGHTSPSFFSSCTTLPPKDRHKHDGLLQERWTVISSVGGLFCIFRSKSPHSALDRFPAKQREILLNLAQTRLSDTLNLRKKY